MEGCTFERCQSCPHKICLTGEIAREQGREAYDKFIAEWEKELGMTESK